MSDPRAYHVGVLWIDAEKGITFEPLCEFPADAEHIHIHRHPDGTITATPMVDVELHFNTRSHLIEMYGDDCQPRDYLSGAQPVWVDCPTGAEEPS